MERGEIGWAGGSKGPDYFIYMGSGPAGWLGVPHEGTIFAEVADEASMAVVANVSKLPVPEPPPGQMHMLAKKRPVTVTPCARACGRRSNGSRASTTTSRSLRTCARARS